MQKPSSNPPEATQATQPAPDSSALPAAFLGRWGRSVAMALLAALLLTGIWVWLGRGTPVRIAAPARGDAAEVVYATGTVEPVHWSKVAALARKRIVEICQCEGQTVTKGQVLARLDDAEERAVLAELEARLKRHSEDAQRLRQLVERNVTSRTAYEEKLTQLAEFDAKVAAQKDRIEDLRLKAPMDGVVLRRDGEIGEIAGTAANDTLLWIGQPKPLRVVAEVNEDDIIRVMVGQKTLLRHEGRSNEPLPARVDSITPKGDPQAKTFRVYLALPDDTPLKVGMTVEANIVTAEAKGVMLIPAEAVSGDQVQVAKGGRVERRRIQTGIRGTRAIEVKGGLKADERIVTPFTASLVDGARVRTTEAQR